MVLSDIHRFASAHTSLVWFTHLAYINIRMTQSCCERLALAEVDWYYSDEVQLYHNTQIQLKLLQAFFDKLLKQACFKILHVTQAGVKGKKLSWHFWTRPIISIKFIDLNQWSCPYKKETVLSPLSSTKFYE